MDVDHLQWLQVKHRAPVRLTLDTYSGRPFAHGNGSATAKGTSTVAFTYWQVPKSLVSLDQEARRI